MRVLLALAISLLAYSSTALAQQPGSPPPTPREQALTNRLIGEINGSLECNTSVVTLQQQVAKLTADLQAEQEKNKTPAKKP